MALPSLYTRAACCWDLVNMDIQTIIASAILLAAVVYTIIRFRKNWQKGDTDPKCDNCDVPDLIKKQRVKKHD